MCCKYSEADQTFRSHNVYRFNSLQTGRCVASRELRDENRHTSPSFQFPSNGKVCCKSYKSEMKGHILSKCFNSLQTGRCVASRRCHLNEVYMNSMKLVSIPFKREGVLQGPSERFSGHISMKELSEFQFPSNGKVCCKWAQMLMIPWL